MPKSKKVVLSSSDPGGVLLEVLRTWDELHEDTGKVQKEKFYQLKRLPKQIEKHLMNIREALLYLPEDLIKRNSQIPLNEFMSDIQTALNTESEKVKLDLFWKLCKHTLPNLELKLELLLKISCIRLRFKGYRMSLRKSLW